MKNKLLGARFRNDDQEVFALSDVQTKARNDIRAKMRSGAYAMEEVACPLCRAKNEHLLSEKDAYGFSVATVICRECSMVYTNPRLTTQALVDMYKTEYRDLDRVKPASVDYFDLEFEKAETLFGFLERNHALSELEGKLIVEIGCGAGGGLKYFADRGFQVAGCDLSPRNVEYGTSRGLNIRYGGIDVLINSLGTHAQNIGLIIYEQVFEHLTDPLNELKRLHGQLNQNYLLYLGVPGLKNIKAHYGADFLRFLQLPHLAHFELHTLVLIAQQTGYQFIDGNETAKAIFRRTDKTVPVQYQDKRYLEVIGYLEGLERYRKSRAPAKLLKEFFIALGMRTKQCVMQSPWIPAPIKRATVQLLKRIYHRAFK